jgi:hemerythrin-like domain-containing protein
MQTTDTLRAEHEGVLLVLDQLERAVAAAERGAPLPTDVFRDIQEFFSVFVDRCHHGKEEAALFPRLMAHGLSAIAQRLEDEHTLGRRLAAAYGRAVAEYAPGQATSGVRLAAAARAYAGFLREHIDLETRELFPAVEATLAEDDQVLTDAFERVEIERIGAGTHERLHGMLDGLAARIDAYVRAGAGDR